jgi:uncharacterized protein
MRFGVMLLKWIACIALICGLAEGAVIPPGPEPRYVHDDAGWLGADAFSSLDLKLEWFERETSSQVVVAVFPRLPEGEELFDYSQRIFDTWMPGRKGKDNGVILLFFDQDRKIRIHVGYGLEGALPDARCARIIRDEIAPKLQAGNREGAVEAGVDAILKSIRGEYEGDGKTLGEEEEAKGGWWILVAGVIFILLGLRFPILFEVAEVIFSAVGLFTGGGSGGSGRSWSSGRSSGGGFSGGGGRSGGGGASGGW